jgi:hypothetical protein
MAELVTCVPRDTFTQPQIHPEAVTVEWQPENPDCLEIRQQQGDLSMKRHCENTDNPSCIPHM